MNIVVENCSSPGAHFSNNTNDSLLKTYDWLVENNGISIGYQELRQKLEVEKGINNNNARNIFPLMKNCGLVSYQNNIAFSTSDFFTNIGLVYIKTLQMERVLIGSDYSDDKKRRAIAEIKKMLNDIIYEALLYLFKNGETNYIESLSWFLLFLKHFGKVNKQEFAFMVYIMGNSQDDWLTETTRVISAYRNNELEIDVKVRVRNDKVLQENTGEFTRLEDLAYFTCFNYYSTLIKQAGLVIESGEYYILSEGSELKINKLLELRNK